MSRPFLMQCVNLDSFGDDMENKDPQHVKLVRQSHEMNVDYDHIRCWQTIDQLQFQLWCGVKTAVLQMINSIGFILIQLFGKDAH